MKAAEMFKDSYCGQIAWDQTILVPASRLYPRLSYVSEDRVMQDLFTKYAV